MGLSRFGLSAAVLTAVASTTLVGVAPPANASTWTNCDSVHHKYPHGVGKKHAHDHTSGTPVRNFKHSTKLYRTAMNHNSGLDGDKDGIACEA